jgi:hypothetical protein
VISYASAVGDFVRAAVNAIVANAPSINASSAMVIVFCRCSLNAGMRASLWRGYTSISPWTIEKEYSPTSMRDSPRMSSF